ncbi:hypothetical protein RRF57_009260 [Xylaria bambusicola]|uniref:Uncharacterized protein n=1 Tax=Xylaria bambusicola TaxID=326684 RepID=A0AAN7Z8V1_9PEZI
MGDALETVDDWAGQIVGRVHLPLRTGAVVGIIRVATVDDGVAHRFIRVVDADLGPDAVLQALLGAILHFLKNR